MSGILETLAVQYIPQLISWAASTPEVKTLAAKAAEEFNSLVNRGVVTTTSQEILADMIEKAALLDGQ